MTVRKIISRVNRAILTDRITLSQALPWLSIKFKALVISLCLPTRASERHGEFLIFSIAFEKNFCFLPEFFKAYFFRVSFYFRKLNLIFEFIDCDEVDFIFSLLVHHWPPAVQSSLSEKYFKNQFSRVLSQKFRPSFIKKSFLINFHCELS